jgi:hypothetical protein
MRLNRGAALGAVVLIWCSATGASAQPFEQGGVRAQGMAGAFVAVADDASAVWWNPAGLASGPFFNLLVEHQQQPDPGGRITGLAMGTPPLGFSYQRLHAFLPAAASAASGRETERRGAYAAMAAHVFGVTLLHSLTSNFVVGTTLKFVHADLGGRGTNRVDLDLGAQYRVGLLRAGVVIRNVTEPSFATEAGEDVTAGRQVRAGVAVAGERTTVAADLDLTDVDDPLRPGRRLALGVEQRFGSRLAARGGVRFRTSGETDPWVSLGGSYAIKTGIWLDGFWGTSPEQDARWGVGARVAY